MTKLNTTPKHLEIRWLIAVSMALSLSISIVVCDNAFGQNNIARKAASSKSALDRYAPVDLTAPAAQGRLNGLNGMLLGDNTLISTGITMSDGVVLMPNGGVLGECLINDGVLIGDGVLIVDSVASAGDNTNGMAPGMSRGFAKEKRLCAKT